VDINKRIEQFIFDVPISTQNSSTKISLLLILNAVNYRTGFPRIIYHKELNLWWKMMEMCTIFP